MKQLIITINLFLVSFAGFSQFVELKIDEIFITQGESATIDLTEYYTFDTPIYDISPYYEEENPVFPGGFQYEKNELEHQFPSLDFELSPNGTLTITPHMSWYIGRELIVMDVDSMDENLQYNVKGVEFEFFVTVEPAQTDIQTSTPEQITQLPKTLYKAYDIYGDEIDSNTTNQVLIYLYTDGTSEKIFITE